jgi:hypothetical protein
VTEPPAPALPELDLAAVVAWLPAPPGSRPVLVAVDGPSSSGKSSFSERLAAALPRAAVVHTDDLAWHHGVLSWDGLLVAHVLPPVRAGRAVRYRPPAWEERGRPGAVEVPAGLTHLLVEGVGVSRASLHDEFDVAFWVRTPRATRQARDEVRLAAGEMSPAGYAGWMAEEEAHFAADRPWERADAVVDGTPELPHDPATELVVAAHPV